jgi:hypothetical protein
MGVCGRLGILKCLGDADAAVAETGASVERYAEVLASVRFSVLTLGGDCGGSTVTAGAIVDNGRWRNRVGDGERLAESLRRGGCNPPRSAPSRSLPLVVRGPSPMGFIPCSRPGICCFTESKLPLLLRWAGLGEIALGAVGLGFIFAICSKWERKEETGFYENVNLAKELQISPSTGNLQ